MNPPYTYTGPDATILRSAAIARAASCGGVAHNAIEDTQAGGGWTVFASIEGEPGYFVCLPLKGELPAAQDIKAAARQRPEFAAYVGLAEVRPYQGYKYLCGPEQSLEREGLLVPLALTP